MRPEMAPRKIKKPLIYILPMGSKRGTNKQKKEPFPSTKRRVFCPDNTPTNPNVRQSPQVHDVI